jgi:hypothetical protein
MLAEKMRNLLLTFLQQDVIIASWGITDIQITTHKLSFSVFGFKYKGNVTIIAGEANDLYDVYMEKQIIRSCKKERIVSILDSLIERDENNYQHLLKEYFRNVLA